MSETRIPRLSRINPEDDDAPTAPDETPIEDEDETAPEPEPPPAPPIGGTPPTRRMVAPPPERTL